MHSTTKRKGRSQLAPTNIDARFRCNLQAHLGSTEQEPELPGDLRRAAVLAILYRHANEVWLPLIQRPSGQGVHGGQIALPGGAFEAGDRTLLDTALREANEEVGVLADTLTVLGRLPPVMVRVSGFVVVPFVACSDLRPAMHPNDSEVQRIVHVRVKLLTNRESLVESVAPPGSLHKTLYEYRLAEGTVWGATARILVSLVEALRADS